MKKSSHFFQKKTQRQRPRGTFTMSSLALCTIAIGLNHLSVVYAWILPCKVQSKVSSLLQVAPLSTEDAEPKTRPSSSPSEYPPPLLDWNASGSIGSMLMQMQKKEEELRKLNQTLLSEEEAEELDPPKQTKKSKSSASSSSRKKGTTSSSSAKTSSSQESSKIQQEDDSSEATIPLEQQQSELDPMDAETAKELDSSVTFLPKRSIGPDVEILELPDLYAQLVSKNQSSLPLPPLSRPDHYKERIGRDMRHLGVSIASSVQEIEEWREFCQEPHRSGIIPLVECIQEGARSIRNRRDESLRVSDYVQTQYEESFLAASSSCRALRDLCALSPEVSAVITDCILRANTACEREHETSLMDDFCTILKYAHDNSEYDYKRSGFWRRKKAKWTISGWKKRREARLRCQLYVMQLLLATTVASDSAVTALRSTRGLQDIVLKCSSYARTEQTRRWLRYPGEVLKQKLSVRKKKSKLKNDEQPERRRQPFIEAASLRTDITGKVQGAANQILAAMGYNQWVPKSPKQKGLRILCLDGGGSRGMVAVTGVDCLVEALGTEISDSFDLIVGTSTGAIISFLIGLRRETSEMAVERYNLLVKKIFTKSALSTPMLLFTTAAYDESHFMNILREILEDETMLDTRADPAVPYVAAVTSVMSSTPTRVALLRNFNYNEEDTLPDPFVIDPDEARISLGLQLEQENDMIRCYTYPRKSVARGGMPGAKRERGASRHPGSFRVLQRYALRASTAAPTVFKPVMMGGEMYCDGGIVASNPAAIAVHEARSVFPDVPIELVVSMGTGGFLEVKNPPRLGWDGIIGQIVNSATDGEQIHHLLEDILGDDGTAKLGRSSLSGTHYVRFNPVIGNPDEFPIDVTEPAKLDRLKAITREYMKEPEVAEKVALVADIVRGRSRLRKFFDRRKSPSKSRRR